MPDIELYAQFVHKVRGYLKTMPLNDAVKKSVDESIKEGILRDFLRKNKTIETIADELETTVNDILEICDVACKHAPEYNAEKVFDELHEMEMAKLRHPL